MAGEDSARVATLQILNAQNRYAPLTSQRPVNWPSNSKLRIDVALKGASSKAKDWCGAIEIKWPGRIAVRKTRSEIVEDVARLAFVKTTNHRINLLLMGGTAESMRKLFDKSHKKQELEAQRQSFSRLLPRSIGTVGYLTRAELAMCFPSFGSRIPSSVLGDFKGRIKAEL